MLDVNPDAELKVSHVNFPSPNILVVSSSKNEQLQIGKMLNDAGFRKIILADTAQSSLRHLNTLAIDLLVVDTELPDMDGWRLSRLVRSGILRCNPEIAILMRAHTWCERIAEVTAREYGINKLIPAAAWDKLIPNIQLLCRAQSSLNSKPRLLVVEDSEDTAYLVQRVLANTYEITIANDGKEGLDLWLTGRHDLVLLDIMLPSMSGDEILVEIVKENPRQPVVVMTAHGNAAEAEALMFAGAADFLSKPFRAEQLRKVCDIAIHRDDYMVSTAQFAAQVKSLEEREREFRNLYLNHHQLLDDLQTIVMELDEKLCIRFINQAWQILTGFSQEDTINQHFSQFVAKDQIDKFDLLIQKIDRIAYQPQASIIDYELCLQTRDQQAIWVELKLSQLNRSAENTTYSVCLDDITERRKSQEKLSYLATHDSLTGLFNRHYCEEHIKNLSTTRGHALLCMDLDHFKVINDTFGHAKGDQLLQEIAQLLVKRSRSTDIVGRLGGDEFAIFLHTIDEASSLQVAESIQKVVSDFSFKVNDQRINLGCSIGIALIDGTAEQQDEYFKRADMALYTAKGRGRNLIHTYNENDDVSDELRSNINIAQKVRAAIRENRLTLYFQPIYDVKKNHISHHEALVRMIEPDGKVVFPGEFIPAMESVGEMHILDRWVIRLAIKALQEHQALTNLAINLSAQAFKDESLVPIIVENLNQSGVDAKRITFELTESASLFNLQTTKDLMQELHQLGCSFSVDDFGSGFSSFAYLKELPADYIKLDGSFIRNMEQDPIDQALVKSMIEVIQAIGKKAIADYVEIGALLRLLINMGIDYAQGYHIGRPQPVELLSLQPYSDKLRPNQTLRDSIG